jgi:hypothetical protein
MNMIMSNACLDGAMLGRSRRPERYHRGSVKTATQPQLKPGEWANAATRAGAKVSLSHGDLAEAGQHQLQFVLVLAAVRRKLRHHVTCGAIPHDSLGMLPGQALIRWRGTSFGFGGGFLAGATVTG